MKTEVRYSLGQLDAIVRMIVEFNEVADNISYDSVRGSLINSLSHIADGSRYVSTLGYMVVPEEEYEDNGVRHITVGFYFDPSLYYQVSYDFDGVTVFGEDVEEEEVISLIADEM